jgi:hypothetical protein
MHQLSAHHHGRLENGKKKPTTVVGPTTNRIIENAKAAKLRDATTDPTNAARSTTRTIAEHCTVAPETEETVANHKVVKASAIKASPIQDIKVTADVEIVVVPMPTADQTVWPAIWSVFVVVA